MLAPATSIWLTAAKPYWRDSTRLAMCPMTRNTVRIRPTRTLYTPSPKPSTIS